MWQTKIQEATQGRCLGCKPCDGVCCTGRIPGWGGYRNNCNFIANVESWNAIDVPPGDELPVVALAPVTGAVQNIGVADEESFYTQLVAAAAYAGIPVCIGDGEPDCKLQFGLAALQKAKVSGCVFIKPYINDVFFRRIEWAIPHAGIIGIDIDSWRIVTMQGQHSMEQKTADQLRAIKAHIPPGIQFAIKGICDSRSVALIKEVQPDIAVVSNHGGRVEAPHIGTAYLLEQYAPQLRPFVTEIWVDGGLRTRQHLQKAKALGAARVLVGRPFIQGMLALGRTGIKTVLTEDFS